MYIGFDTQHGVNPWNVSAFGFRENEESPNTTSKKRKRVDDVIKGITIAANILGEKLEKAANNMNQAILGETKVQKKKLRWIFLKFQKCNL
uniref:Uncharacterized protein n=1 Tax=Lactuca sativa TaxID=4236 RepID=A0A9R1W475_LACSA|nr:hypothetical protein LSAT_V11C300153620 [Lactuca sativa]